MYRNWEDFAIQRKLVMDVGVPIPIPFLVHNVTAERIEVSFLHFNNKKILHALEEVCNEYKLTVIPGVTEAWLRTELPSTMFKFLYKDFIDQFIKPKQ